MIATLSKRTLKPLPGGATDIEKSFYPEVSEILSYIQDQVILSFSKVGSLQGSLVTFSKALSIGSNDIIIDHSLGKIPAFIFSAVPDNSIYTYGYIVAKERNFFTIRVVASVAGTQTLSFLVG